MFEISEKSVIYDKIGRKKAGNPFANPPFEKLKPENGWWWTDKIVSQLTISVCPPLPFSSRASHPTSYGVKVTADSWANIHSNSHYTMSPVGNNTMAVFVKNKSKMSNHSSFKPGLGGRRDRRRLRRLKRETFWKRHLRVTTLGLCKHGPDVAS